MFVRKDVDLDTGSRPRCILRSGNAVILEGDGPWRIFDRDLQPVEKGYLFASHVFLSSHSDRMFLTDENGMLETRRISDGKQLFVFPLTFGWDYFRSFVVDVGDRLIVVSSERRVDRDSPNLPKDSTIEVVEFQSRDEVDTDGILRSARVRAETIIDTLRLRTAFEGETLITASPDQLCLFDLGLNIKSAFLGAFEPISLSVVNSSMIYMVGSVGPELTLFALTFEGDLLYSVSLPLAIDYRSYPPIVDFSGNVFILGRVGLVTFDPAGNARWEYRPPNEIIGAVVTPDNDLIISSGSELGVFDASGGYHLLHEFKGEALLTPPAVTDNGDVLVATEQKLYCLSTEEI